LRWSGLRAFGTITEPTPPNKVSISTSKKDVEDIGMRRDMVKIQVEDLTRRLAIGLLQVVEPQISMNLAHQSTQIVSQ
jgi:hypothetical protein